MAHYEDDAQRDRVKDHAYAAIAAARYHGEQKKYIVGYHISHSNCLTDRSWGRNERTNNDVTSLINFRAKEHVNKRYKLLPKVKKE